MKAREEAFSPLSHWRWLSSLTMGDHFIHDLVEQVHNQLMTWLPSDGADELYWKLIATKQPLSWKTAEEQWQEVNSAAVMFLSDIGGVSSPAQRWDNVSLRTHRL